MLWNDESSHVDGGRERREEERIASGVKLKSGVLPSGFAYRCGSVSGRQVSELPLVSLSALSLFGG